MILFSCKKQAVDIGPDFDRIIGQWKSVNGDERVYITVKKNGVINISKATQRNKKFKITQLIDEPNVHVNSGMEWKAKFCFNESDLGKSIYYFHKEGNEDSIIFYIGDYVENFSFINKDQFFVRDGN